jgi:hypothetical protein
MPGDSDKMLAETGKHRHLPLLIYKESRFKGRQNIKSQAPNYKQISNSNIQLPKHKRGLEF